MAEAVIDIIAEKIVLFLTSEAIETVAKLWGVKHELEALKDTVSMLQPFLDHAEEQYHKIPHVRRWVEKLKDAFYDAQDVLEEFNIEAMRRELRGHNKMMKEVRTFFSSSNQVAFKLKMSDKVRAVRERIQALQAIKATWEFNLDERPVHSRVERERRKREGHSFIGEEDIVGRHDDKKGVMNFLMNSDVKEDISILPIVGIGGVGKTALAKCVYQGSIFDLKMWVCVSTDFDVNRIAKDMIACARKDEPTEDIMEVLQTKLREEINGKKYLLVLDDVWTIDQETWISLKTLLVRGARGSKILITTRDERIARITGTVPSHFLQDLSESASLELLMKMAGRKIEEIKDFEMLNIGREIVRKFCGVPLVVRAVGSLLFFKETTSEWLHFKDHELPEVPQNEENLISVLRLSYDHLPSHLKQCFAFCSLFPKDYEIKKTTLVDLWMAEGFIHQSNTSQHLEDIAYGYFMDLLWGNFFQDFQKDSETCKMHDLMHDMARSVAGSECWMAWDDTKPIPKRTRHISNDSTLNSMDKLSISHLKTSALRTFLSIDGNWESMSKAELRKLIQSFKRLRILDLHAKNIKKVPRSICKLEHLTYLDVSQNRSLKRLPESITKLQNLQTLNLSKCFSLEELPRDIKKLVSLRNLDIDGCWKLSYLPHGLGQLSSLHRLTRFILPKEKALDKNYCGLGELNVLNNIRGSLCIENLGSVMDVAAESGAANLMEKRSLESLTLELGNFDADDAIIKDRDEALFEGLRPHSNLRELRIDGYKGESFPRWMVDELVSSLPNLVKACFRDCGRCTHLPPLGQLRHLRSLEIYRMSELEYIKSDCSSTSTASFPSLLRLVIDGCENLKAMPPTPHLEYLELTRSNSELTNHLFGLNKLKRLAIWKMEFLKCLPEECLKSLTSLESLRISNCPRLISLSSLGMRHLSSLVDLSISDCLELDLCKDESGDDILDFHGGGLLHGLRSVDIFRLPKLECLPQWLVRASTLERLDVFSCENLKELPEQIGDLQSLQRLEIKHCSSLTSLPEGMRRLASLPHLTVYGCPGLKERCKRDGGEDWCKIAHIPHISHHPYGSW
ncbi:uncharacterized protein J3R85_000092 [Psidium guajava]|nr:uncharacterized protein J3R85_000092 [Psidium guajava]